MNYTEQKITNLIESVILELGYNLVRVLLIQNNGNTTLQIMIERIDEKGITVKDCSIVSKKISLLLEESNIITNKYNLEVSSTGINRPLLKLKDYDKYLGNNIKVKLKTAVNERKNFKGVIIKVINNIITLNNEGNLINIEFDNILSAELNPEIKFK